MRQKQGVFSLFLLSPSSRRAWIEMRKCRGWNDREAVALLAEGVDRNVPCRLLWEHWEKSPSSRRAWIEICHTSCKD